MLLLSTAHGFHLAVTLSGTRGAERHSPRGIRIVIVVGAVAVDIVEVVIVVGGAQPPPGGALKIFST